MGQVDRLGLKSIGKLGLSDSDRGIGLPKRDREDKPRPGTTVVDKKKKKSKAAGGGGTPPKKPPTRGPKGPNWPNIDDDNKNKKSKSLGGLTKGTLSKNDEKINPRKEFERKQSK
jgi:hypothetical protein